MTRTFVPCLIVVCLLAGFASAAGQKEDAPKKIAAPNQVLFSPEKDKPIIFHPVYRPGIDKFQVIHPVYRPGIDKFEIRNLSDKHVLVMPVISKQTPTTLTSNTIEEYLKLRDSATAKVPVKSERGSSECSEKGQPSSK